MLVERLKVEIKFQRDDNSLRELQDENAMQIRESIAKGRTMGYLEFDGEKKGKRFLNGPIPSDDMIDTHESIFGQIKRREEELDKLIDTFTYSNTTIEVHHKDRDDDITSDVIWTLEFLSHEMSAINI